MSMQIQFIALIRHTLAGTFMAMVMATSAALAADLAARQTGTVDAEGVHLSDLFIGIDAAADRWVGPAPAPGETVTYKANLLASIARGNALDWRPQSRR